MKNFCIKCGKETKHGNFCFKCETEIEDYLKEIEKIDNKVRKIIEKSEVSGFANIGLLEDFFDFWYDRVEDWDV